MSTMVEEFIADLGDDLQDDESEGEEILSEEAQKQQQQQQELEEKMKVEIDTLKYNNVKEIAHLLRSQKLRTLISKIDERMKVERKEGILGPAEEDPEYQMIVDSNTIILEITHEIAVVHKFIRDHYAKKFPELESLVVNPLDYAQVVKRIANETDMTAVQLQDILPAATVMIVSLTASTTSGSKLPREQMDKIVEACEEVIALDDARIKILDFVQTRMSIIAPNLTLILGSSISAQLMGQAGGLRSLANMPSGQLALLGINRKVLSGFSTATTLVHTGYIYNSEIVQKSSTVVEREGGEIGREQSDLGCPGGWLQRMSGRFRRPPVTRRDREEVGKASGTATRQAGQTAAGS
eukprot:TRINITY_DN8320_c0_g1_i1.p1 TRINITY_DN8320_c0_g1~~TRINITY_DN8320_c0_g1_i1.p1  ORF type:complete len:380 (-),score=86.55 TRINITY_DN8320_c0_g1_i1:716-1774(-)